MEQKAKTIILDVEGTDGRERGEDKVTRKQFQIAIFTLLYRILKEKLPFLLWL